MPSPILSVRHASVRRSGKYILDDVSLDLCEGEKVAIIGPNGAGKSTLVGVMCRKVHPLANDNFSYSLFGRGRWPVSEVRLLIGHASQAESMVVETTYTVFEIVLSALYSAIGLDFHITPTEDDRRKANEAIAKVGLSHLADKCVNSLSSGEKAKVLLARAAVNDPPIMLLDEASVTGTANIIMAAVFAEGFTTIYNAACEPYVQQLCRMLNRMGARISGIASNLLTIEGVRELHGTEHTLLPDMIEVGSFIGMAAMTRSELTIKDVSYDNLGIIPAQFARLGIRFEQRGDDIYIPEQEHYAIESFIDGSIMTIADAPWPGLTPDLLSIFLVVATQAKGAVLIHQKMFESRLFFVDKLIDMGAQIILCDPHRATVIGHDRRIPLRATRMSSPDIRAGVALLIAAMSAEGTSTIQNIEQIDRGYRDIDGRLNALGARITRIEE